MNISLPSVMKVGLAKLHLTFPKCQNQQEQNLILTEWENHLAENFKISLFVFPHAKWQRLQVGFSLIRSESEAVQQDLDEIVNVFEEDDRCCLVESMTEIIEF